MKYLFFILGLILSGYMIIGCNSNILDRDLNVEEFNKQIEGGDVHILDVRTQEEFAEGNIPNSINIDYYSTDFKEKIASLDKSKTYLVYCRSGKRSASSCTIMEELEFKKIYNLLGGYLAWSE